MRRLIAAATLLLVLAACSAAPAPGPDAPDRAAGEAAALLQAHDLDGMDARQLINHLDRLPVAERPTDLLASVRGDELLLADSRHEVAMGLPDDAFYVSVAPYVEQTHDCYYHSLTTCRGELANAPVQVRAVDATSGTVLVEEDRTTFDNGFVGLWLPRDLNVTLEVTHQGRAGSVGITTTDDAATCLTTLRLT